MKKIIPASPEAERAIIGSCLMNPDAMHECMGSVFIKDFTDQYCQDAFRSMKKLYRDSMAVDMVSVHETMDCKNKEILLSIIEETPISSGVKSYIKLVKESTTKRQLIKYAQDITETCYDGDCKDAIEKSHKMISSFCDENSRQEFREISETFEEVVEYINKSKDGKVTNAVHTGVTAIDRYITGGFEPGNLVILAARPGVGKTAMALNIAKKCRRKVALVSLEMKSREIYIRFASMISGKSQGDIKRGDLTEEEMSNVFTEIKKMRCFVDDSMNSNVDMLCASIESLYRKEKPKMVIIDYLQLLGARYGNSTNDKVAYISKRLKRLAMELGIPVIALSQFSREGAKQKRRPQLTDLRDSGSIEQDADVVIFLHPIEDMGDSSEVNVDCIIAKHRCGGTGTSGMIFKRDSQNFITK